MKLIKNLIVILSLTLSLYSGDLYSQRILGAITAGMNLTQVDGDEIYGFRKTGFNLGPSVIIPFGKNKKFSLNMELLFSQKGSYQAMGPSDTLGEPQPYYKLKLSYVEIPVFVKYTDKNIVSGGLGFSYGQLVGVKEVEHGTQTETNLQGPYTKSDLEMLADVQLKIYQRLWFNVRYSYTLIPIRTRHYSVPIPNGSEEWDRKQYNNVITFRLIYVFNQELTRRAGKKK